MPTASGNSALRAGSDEQGSLSNHDNEESPPQEEEENDREDDEFDDPSDEGPRRDNLWTYGEELEELLQTRQEQLAVERPTTKVLKKLKLEKTLIERGSKPRTDG